VGWTDEGHEGNFTNVNTGEMLDTQLGNDLLKAGEPNGGEGENCLLFWYGKKGWFDMDCQRKYNTFCYFKTFSIFKVRGEPINN
jgi:hypothetical protein